MIRLALAGAHTHLTSPLCARCPQGSTGCCAAPPVVAWADLGRIVSLGGRDWLLAEIAAGRLRPCPRGLAIDRVENPDAAATGWPRRCVYHGAKGCTIAPERRSATCNYYVCDDAFEHAERRGDPSVARRVHDRLTELYARWDLELAAQVGEPSWDAAFLDALGAAFERLARDAGRDLVR